MEYDIKIFEAFRAKAVTSVDDLVIGETYYSNSWPDKFTLLDILTTKQMCERRGTEPYECNSKWMLCELDDGRKTECSTSDQNIGASYNPWLVFADEATAIECREKLIVTHSPKRDFDYFDYPCEA